MSYMDIALGVVVWVIVGLTLAKLKGPTAFAIAWVAGLAFAAIVAFVASADHGHGHTHGRVDRSIVRSRAGVRAVSISLALLAVTAALQAIVFFLSGSVALLADLIHNGGDALTAIPLAIAFLARSERGERWAGYAVVLTIFVSASVAAYEAVQRNAVKAWSSKSDFLALLENDAVVSQRLPPAELRALFDLGYHLKHVDTIFRRVFGEAYGQSAP